MMRKQVYISVQLTHFWLTQGPCLADVNAAARCLSATRTDTERINSHISGPIRPICQSEFQIFSLTDHRTQCQPEQQQALAFMRALVGEKASEFSLLTVVKVQVEKQNKTTKPSLLQCFCSWQTCEEETFQMSNLHFQIGFAAKDQLWSEKAVKVHSWHTQWSSNLTQGHSWHHRLFYFILLPLLLSPVIFFVFGWGQSGDDSTHQTSMQLSDCGRQNILTSICPFSWEQQSPRQWRWSPPAGHRSRCRLPGRSSGPLCHRQKHTHTHTLIFYHIQQIFNS